MDVSSVCAPSDCIIVSDLAASGNRLFFPETVRETSGFLSVTQAHGKQRNGLPDPAVTRSVVRAVVVIAIVGAIHVPLGD
jgi:hypothetical protein